MAMRKHFAIQILKIKSFSLISSFLAGVLVAASINILTGLLYLSTSDIAVNLPWCIVSSVSLLGAGVLSIIISWKIDEIKEIAYVLKKPEYYEPKKHEGADYWTYSINEHDELRKKAIKIVNYLIFGVALMLIGFLTVSAWAIWNLCYLDSIQQSILHGKK